MRNTRLFMIVVTGACVGGTIHTLHAEESTIRRTTQWAPFVEWSFKNPTYDGNPYDLVVDATFVHKRTGMRLKTPLFYNRNDGWKLRFAGTHIGTWTFETSSRDVDLDGKRGTVHVAVNPGAKGFISGKGEKWVRPVGSAAKLEAFVPQFVMYGNPANFAGAPNRVDDAIGEFIVKHGFTGFHVSVFCRWFDLDQPRSDKIQSPDPNPDPRTFAALETLITKVHAAGGAVHLWMWGDEQRRQTPAKWGINGKTDRRLQRYIAARLAPLPGWTMGYGFDLDEWVNEAQIHDWRKNMRSLMAWPHMLGGRHGDPNRGTDHSMTLSWNRGLDYSSFEHHRPTYDVYVAAIQSLPGRPAFSEDRFRIRDSKQYRQKDYNLERTRRGLWNSAMAGGVANIWGNLVTDPGVRTAEGVSAPYPNFQQIRTYASFFEHRFRVDLVRDRSISSARVLRVPGHQRLLIYQEDAAAITLDLSGMKRPRRAVAVDTQLPYKEIDLGTLDPKRQVWKAPYRSDWAMAIGRWQ